MRQKFKEGKCTGNHSYKGCGQDNKLIVNATYKLCYKCNNERLLSKKPKQQGGAGELKCFQEIWNTRTHFSEVSGTPLGYKMQVIFFSHILPKGNYPEYRLNKKNILLKTAQEHHDWEFFRHKLRDIPQWKKIFELEEKLKEEYNEKFRRNRQL